MRDLTVEPEEIEPLVRIDQYDPSGITVWCRDCATSIPLAIQTLTHADIQRKRHLAAHLRVLAQEIAEAAR